MWRATSEVLWKSVPANSSLLFDAWPSEISWLVSGGEWLILRRSRNKILHLQLILSLQDQIRSELLISSVLRDPAYRDSGAWHQGFEILGHTCTYARSPTLASFRDDAFTYHLLINHRENLLCIYYLIQSCISLIKAILFFFWNKIIRLGMINLINP
jgi:hypothetical protein